MEIKKKYIFIILITFMMILNLGAVVMAQDGNITIEQIIPAEIYPNDSEGKNYKAEIINNTEEEIDNLEVKLDLPNSFSFTKSQINELKIVGENGSEQSIGSNDYDFIKNDSIYTITLKDNGETLAPGSSMIIDYNLSTNEELNNQGKVLEIAFNYSDQDDTSLTKTATETLDNKILFGELDIDLSLSEQPMHRDGEFTVTATITNEGEGKLFNTTLTPDESDGFSEPTIVTGEDTIPELESGNSYTFEYTYTVVDNKNFDTLELKAENPATKVPDVTESANFRFNPRKPFIEIDPPTDSATIDFDTSDLIQIEVTNTTDGEGPARDLEIKSNIPADYDVINLNDGWSYDNGIFTYDNDDFPSNNDQNYSETLSFKLQTEDPLNQNKNGTITLQAEYKDDERFNYNRPFETFDYEVENIPNLTIESSASTTANHNDTDRMYLGEEISYTYTVSLTEFDKFTNDDIVVELTNFDDTRLSYLNHDAGIGTFDSGTKTWTLAPSDLDGQGKSITIDFRITDDKTKAKAKVPTKAKVSGKLKLSDTNEITIDDNTSNSFYLQSRYQEVNLGQQTKEYINLPDEGSYDYTRTDNHHRVIYEVSYNFEEDSDGNWTGSSITDDMDNGQIYNGTDGFIKYSTDGGTNWNDVPADDINSTEGNLQFNLDFLVDKENLDDSVAGKTVHFKYKLEVTQNGDFPSWTTLNLNLGNNKFEKFNQVVEVPVSGANADVNIDVQKDGSKANDIDKGEKVDLKIDVSKNPWMIKDLKVKVKADGFTYGDYSDIQNFDEIEITGFGGYSPDISYDSTNYLIIFDFSGAGKFIDQNSTNSEMKNLGTITLNNMIKDCSETFTAGAEIDYRHGLIDSNEDSITKTDQSQVPLIKRDSELIITAVNPVIVTEESVTWSVEVTNTDIGTAHNVEFIGGLSEIFNYQSAKINGSDVSSTIKNGERVWQIGDISSGESKILEITANITDADNRDVKGLDNAFNSKVKWYTEEVNGNKYECGSNERNNFPKFLEPIYSTDLNVKNNLISPDKINICSDGTLEIVINNDGKTTNYNLEVIQNFLNKGIRFDPTPTKNIEVTDKEGTNSYNITASEIENSDGSKLTFNQSIISELSSIEKGEEIKISFGIKTNSSFNEENEIKPVIKWNPPSKYAQDEKKFSRDGNRYQVPRKRPEINIDLKGRNKTIGEQTFVDNPAAFDGETVVWKFKVENIGDGKAKNLRINSDLLEGQELYTAEGLTGSPVSYNNSGGYWEIADLDANQTATYYLAYDVPVGSDNPKTVTADVSWGCDNDTNRLSTPDSSDSSALTTKPVINFSHKAENLTRKDGTITITMENTGAPIYNLDFDYNLSERYKLSDSDIEYNVVSSTGSSDKTFNWSNINIEPDSDDTLNDLQWGINNGTDDKPIPAGTYEIKFDLVHNGTQISDPANEITLNKITANYDSLDTNKEYTLKDLTPKYVDLSIDISPEKQVISSLGDEVKWTISVNNDGNTKAINTKVEQVLGSGFNDNDLTYELSDEVINSLSDLEIPANDNIEITVTTTLNDNGSDPDYTNTVQAKEISTYPGGETESITDLKETYTAAFNLTKEIVDTSQSELGYAPGEVVEYKVTAKLLGNLDYNNLTITDKLPDGLTEDKSIYDFVDQTNLSLDTGEIVWTPSDTSGISDQSVNYKLRVVKDKDNGASKGKLISNTATASFEIDGQNFNYENISDDENNKYRKALRDTASFTFQEPELSISREVTPTQINAGTNVSHTITISNSSEENVSPAYETKIIESVPEGFRDKISNIADTDNVVVKNDGTKLTKGSDYNLSYDNNDNLIIELLDKTNTVLHPGNELIITYDSEADNDIPAGNEYTFNASIVEYYSLESGTNNVEQYPDQTTNVTKTLESIDSNFSASASPKDVSPGDKVTYTLEFDVPAKTTISSFDLSAVLPEGLDYIVGTVSGPGNPKDRNDKSLGEWEPTDSDINGDPESGGQSINFPTNVVSITNNSDSVYEYSLSFEVMVLNTDAIRNNNNLTTNFTYKYNNNQLSGNVVLNVIEPDLVLNKGFENVSEEASNEAGDTIEYTITINHSGSSTADAYDLKVEDIIPDGLSYIDNSMTTNSDLNIITSTDKSGQTLTWNIDEFKLSDGPVDLTYRVKIDDSVEPAAVLKNAANLKWTSHPDDDNVEQRRGIKDDTLNDYILTTDTDLTINDNISINKTIISAGTNYTIGDTVRYQLDIGLIQGTINGLEVNNLIPAGLKADNFTLKDGDGNVLTKTDYLTDQDLSDNNLIFDEIVNSASDGIAGDKITIEYDAIVENVTDNQNGVTKEITTSLSYNDAEGNQQNVTADKTPFDIKEPDLVLNKRFAAGSYEAGDKVEYTITLNHSGSSTATAYDLVVEDIIPTGMTYVDNSMTTAVDSLTIRTNNNSQNLSWTIDELDPLYDSNNKVKLTYQVKIDDDVTATTVLNNEAKLNWTSQIGDNQEERKGKGDSLNDYNVKETVSLTTAPDLTVVDKITNDTTPIVEGTTNIEQSGETVHITINGTDYATEVDEDGSWSVEITEQLTNGDYTVEASITDDSPGAGTTTAEGTITVDTNYPSINIEDKVTNDRTPPLTGSSDQPAGSEVNVLIKDKDGNEIFSGNTTVQDEEGNWSIDVDQELEEGNYNVKAETTDKAGNTATDEADLEIDTTAPTITAEDKVTNDRTPPLTGGSDQPAGSEVNVLITDKEGNEIFSGDTTVQDEEGNWSIDVDQELEEGNYNVEAETTDEAGNTAVDEADLEIDTTAPTITAEDKVTNDRTPPLTGSSDQPKGSEVNVLVTDKDGNEIFSGNTTVQDEEGNWSIDVDQELEEGNYNVEAETTDEAGNTAVDEADLKIDTTDPNITTEDKTTGNTTPLLKGTTDEPKDSKVDIKVKDKNGNVIFEGESIVENNGNWNIDTETEGQWTGSSTEFAEGDYEIEASIKDAGGNKAIDTGQLRVYTSTPKIEVELTGAHNSRKPGEETSYTLTISNNGKTEVKDMKITTLLPAGFELDKETIKINNSLIDQEQFEYNGNNLIIKRDELKDGSVLNIEISGKIKSDGENVLAGSILSTKSKVDYKDILDNIYQKESNIAELEISRIHSINIQPDRYVAGSPNSQAVFAHKIANKGNTLEKTNLSLQGLEDFEVAWYYDSNENGNFDQNDELIISSQRKDIKLKTLAPKGDSNIFLVINIKDVAVNGEKEFKIIAESNIENNISDEVNNKLTILDNIPKLNLYDPQNREAVYAGSSYNLKLDYGNLGENVLKNAQLKINLSKNVKDAELLNTSEDYSYDSTTNTIIVDLADLQPSEERTISLNMTLKNDVPQGTEINTKVDFIQNDIKVIDDSHSIIAANEDPSIIDLSADPETIRGDGQSTSLLTASIKDLMGNFVKDNTEVRFEIDNELLGKDNLVKEEGFTTEIENVGTDNLLRAKVDTKNGLAKINLKAPKISSNEILEIPVNVIAENKDTGKVEETIYMVFSPGVLLGRVIDSDTGLPETGKEVRLIKNDNLIQTTQTDENGRYSFIIEEDGDYEIHVIDNLDKKERIKTKKYAEAGNNELTLGPRAIEGRLYYRDTDKPIANTQVKLYSPEGNLYGTTKTNGNGQYSFELEDKVVSNSIQSISLQNNNNNNKWLLQSLDGKVKRGVTDPKAGDMILDADLPVLANNNYGQVLSQKDNEKLEDVKVKLINSNTGEEVLLPEINSTNQDNPYFTNADGEYLFEDVSPGTYYLTAEKEGYYDYKSEEIALSSKSDINNTINMEQINNDDLEIEKVADVKYGLPEEEITYTIRITNNKEEIINELKVTDILPEKLLYIEDTANLNGNYENGKIIWELTDIQPGVTELKYKVRVDKNVDLGKEVVNNVDVNLNGVIIKESHQLQIKPPEIIVTKTSNKDQIKIGDFISYQIKVENNTDYDLDSFILYDKLPPGFKYIESSASQIKSDNKKVKIKSQGERLIKWDQLSLKANENLTIEYTLVVGSGVIIGEKYVNKAYAKTEDLLISNIAQKSVRVKIDPVFNTSAILGKVFFDENGNGVQDNGEKGLSKVDIISNTGQIITTDQYGRYHLRLETSKTNNIGYTIILKLDKDSLPKNVEVMSDNPAIVKTSNGMIEKVNFRVKNSN